MILGQTRSFLQHRLEQFLHSCTTLRMLNRGSSVKSDLRIRIGTSLDLVLARAALHIKSSSFHLCAAWRASLVQEKLLALYVDIPTSAYEIHCSIHFLRWGARTMALLGGSPLRFTIKPFPLLLPNPKVSRRQTTPELHPTMIHILPGQVLGVPTMKSRLSPSGSSLSWPSFPFPSRPP